MKLNWNFLGGGGGGVGCKQKTFCGGWKYGYFLELQVIFIISSQTEAIITVVFYFVLKKCDSLIAC